MEGVDSIRLTLGIHFFFSETILRILLTGKQGHHKLCGRSIYVTRWSTENKAWHAFFWTCLIKTGP